jgi:hypothetical protein
LRPKASEELFLVNQRYLIKSFMEALSKGVRGLAICITLKGQDSNLFVV